MTGRLSGKVALVTGAGRGQGRSHAVLMASEGADIIAIDICAPVAEAAYPMSSPSDLAETVRLVEATGRRILAYEIDIREGEALTAAVAGAVDELGRLDVVVANAGIACFAPWNEVTPALWRAVIDVNLTGTWNTVMAGAPHLINAGGGSIILISSSAGLVAQPMLTPYVASKHGVTGVARSFALELAQHNIRVNSIHPTGVDTPMVNNPAVAAGLERIDTSNPKFGVAFANMLDVELVQAIDVSYAVLFLASDESRS